MALKVLSLNLWHNAGSWKDRAARIREWIVRLDPDLIGFQEVLQGDSVDLVAQILEGSAFHTEFLEASPFWLDDSVSFGNAVASRWPVLRRKPLRLPESGDGETRSALTVVVDSPLRCGEIAFTCTHLNWKLHHGATRERQVVALAEHVLKHRTESGFPPILVGDFNAEPDSDEIRFLCGLRSIDGRSVYFNDAWRVAGDGDHGTTWSNRNPYARANLEPDRRLDYVFAGYPMLNGLGRVDHCRVVCNDHTDGVWPSDHFGVYAELRSEPRPGEGVASQ